MSLPSEYKYQTQSTPSPNDMWAKLVGEEILTLDISNRIRLTYSAVFEGEVVTTGNVVWEYTINSESTPQIRLVQQYISGDKGDVEWIIDTSYTNYLDLLVRVTKPGYIVYYNIEYDRTPHKIYPNEAPWNYSTPRSFVYADSIYSVEEGWNINGYGDLYNTNLSGRVGINTGLNPVSTAMLEVQGDQLLIGDLMFDKRNGDYRVAVGSAQNGGYDFRVHNMTFDKPRLYIDSVGQVGINTNSPSAMLHVEGSSVFRERMAIGAWNVPNAKLHIVGETNTAQTYSLKVHDKNNKVLFSVRDDGEVTGMGGGDVGNPVVAFDATYPNILRIELQDTTAFFVDNVPVLGDDGKIDVAQLPDGIGNSKWENSLGVLGEIRPKTVGEGLHPYVDLGRGWGLKDDGSGYVTSFGQYIGEGDPRMALTTVDWDDDNQVVSAKAIASRIGAEILDDLKDVEAKIATFEGRFRTSAEFVLTIVDGDVRYLFPPDTPITLSGGNEPPRGALVSTATYNVHDGFTVVILSHPITSIKYTHITSHVKAEDNAFLMHTNGYWNPRTIKLGSTVKDVKISGALAGNTLVYDGTFWTNSTETGEYLSKVHDDRAEGNIGIQADPTRDTALTVGGYLALEVGNRVNTIESDPTHTPTNPSSDTLLTESMIWPHIKKKEAGVNGILTWGKPGISRTDDTHFKVYAGTGRIYPAYSDSTNFLAEDVSWNEETHTIIPTKHYGVEHISVDANGLIHYSSSPPVDWQARDLIYLGYAIYESDAIKNIVPSPNVTDSTGTILGDYFRFLHDDHQLYGAPVIHKTDREVYTEAGEFFHPGISYFASKLSPNRLAILANGGSATAASYYHVTKDGNVSSGNDEMPLEWSTGSASTNLDPGKSTIHTLYIIPGGSQYMLYGQIQYATASEAKEALESYSAVVKVPDVLKSALFLAYVIVDDSNKTDLKIYNRGFEVVGTSPPASEVEILDKTPGENKKVWSSIYTEEKLVWKMDTDIISPLSTTSQVQIGATPVGLSMASLHVGGDVEITGAITLGRLPSTTDTDIEYVVRDSSNIISTITSPIFKKALALKSAELADVNAPLVETSRQVMIRMGANSNYEVRTLNLDDLSDITINTLASGDTLVYNDGIPSWENIPAPPPLSDTVFGSNTNTNKFLNHVEFDDVGRVTSWGSTDLDKIYLKIPADGYDNYSHWTFNDGTSTFDVGSKEEFTLIGGGGVRLTTDLVAKSVQIDVDNPVDQYISDVLFNEGKLQFKYKELGDPTVIVNLDGRYSYDDHTHDTRYDDYQGWLYNVDGAEFLIGSGDLLNFTGRDGISITPELGGISIGSDGRLKELVDLTYASDTVLGLDSGGSVVNIDTSAFGTYEVKVRAADTPGYLDSKFTGGNNISLTISDNDITIDNDLDIVDSSISGTSLYSSQKIESIVSAAAKGITYVVADLTERDALRPTVGEQCLIDNPSVVDGSNTYNRPVYLAEAINPDGSANWRHMYDMGVDIAGYLFKADSGAPDKFWMGGTAGFQRVNYKYLDNLPREVIAHDHGKLSAEGQVDHGDLTGILTNRHIDHTSVHIIGTAGLEGKGSIEKSVEIKHKQGVSGPLEAFRTNVIQSITLDDYGHPTSIKSADVAGMKLGYLPIAGGTLTGSLILDGTPVLPLEAVTKEYVDDKFGVQKLGDLDDVTTNPLGGVGNVIVRSNVGFNERLLTLSDLEDVTFGTAPTNEDVLTYSPTGWVAVTPPSGASDFSGSANGNIVISNMQFDSTGRVTGFGEKNLDERYMLASTPHDNYSHWRYSDGVSPAVFVPSDALVTFTAGPNIQILAEAGKLTISADHTHKIGELSDVTPGLARQILTWNTAGGMDNVDIDFFDIYKVKSTVGDGSPDYLNAKILQGDGISITKNTGGLVISNDLRIDDDTASDTALYSSAKVEDLVSAAAKGITYVVADLAEMNALTPTVGEQCLVDSGLRPVYLAETINPDGSAVWKYMYDMGVNLTDYLLKSDIGADGTFYKGGGNFEQVDFSHITGDIPAHLHNGTIGQGGRVSHNDLTDVVANQHVDHATISITGDGELEGGGSIDANQTITHKKHTPFNLPQTGDTVLQSIVTNEYGHIIDVGTLDLSHYYTFNPDVLPYLQLGGGTMTGALKLPITPPGNDEAVRKDYVDNELNALQLDSLNDVTITSLVLDNVLQWTGTTWANQPLDLDSLGGIPKDTTIQLIPGAGISIAPTGGQLLKDNLEFTIASTLGVENKGANKLVTSKNDASDTLVAHDDLIFESGALTVEKGKINLASASIHTAASVSGASQDLIFSTESRNDPGTDPIGRLTITSLGDVDINKEHLSVFFAIRGSGTGSPDALFVNAETKKVSININDATEAIIPATLAVGGSFSANIVAASVGSVYKVKDDDYTVICPDGITSVEFPDPKEHKGRMIYVKASTSPRNTTLSGPSSFSKVFFTNEAVSSIDIAGGTTAILQSDETHWQLLSGEDKTIRP